jgi:hypothetical protein
MKYLPMACRAMRQPDFPEKMIAADVIAVGVGIENHPDGSRGNADSPEQPFGLGHATRVTRVDEHWFGAAQREVIGV